MNFNWYEISHEGNDLIEQAAQDAIDSYEEGADLYEYVTDACDYHTMFYAEQLVLIAYYGTTEAFTGDFASYEDSPAAKFCQDVYELAEKLLADSKED